MSANRLDLVGSVIAAAPPERVWAVFTDAARWPTWARGVEEVSAAPERWVAGERLAFRLRLGGAVVGFDVRLDEVIPVERVVWSSVRWSVTGTRTHSFAAEDGGCRVRDHKRFTHPFLPLAWLYPRGIIRRMSADWLEDLAAEAERSG